MENKKKEILFIAQYPESVSPGQRFRFELYKDLLEKNGFNTTTRSFLDKDGYDIIHKPGFLLKKTWAVLNGYLNRIALLFRLKKYDFIFLQREASPLGPPIFEWFSIKIFKKKVIYDFDDAIWMPHISENNSVALTLKSVHKVSSICKWAYKVSCGNQFLYNFALQYNQNVIYNPTCVDTENRHNKISNHNTDRITIGWTGSFSTLKYLHMLESVLNRLQEQYDFDVKIICNEVPTLKIKNIKFVQWTEQNEVDELSTCQIGLMPLTNEPWSEGKCGFKLIQYLSLGIPAVSSAIGVNKTIIEDGVNGFLCETDDEWYNALEKLLTNTTLRTEMGKAGRKKIINEFSLSFNKSNFLNLFI